MLSYLGCIARRAPKGVYNVLERQTLVSKCKSHVDVAVNRSSLLHSSSLHLNNICGDGGFVVYRDDAPFSMESATQVRCLVGIREARELENTPYNMMSPMAQFFEKVQGAHFARGLLATREFFGRSMLTIMAVTPFSLLPILLPERLMGDRDPESSEEHDTHEDAGWSNFLNSSVKRKRSAKMKRHKWKKRRKEIRQTARKH